jgi:hypothetical protein
MYIKNHKSCQVINNHTTLKLTRLLFGFFRVKYAIHLSLGNKKLFFVDCDSFRTFFRIRKNFIVYIEFTFIFP